MTVTPTSGWVSVKGSLTLRNGTLAGGLGEVLRASGAGVVVALERLQVTGGRVSVWHGAKARMADVTITKSRSVGLHVFGGAEADMDRVVITECTKRGLRVQDAGSVARVRGGRIAQCGEGGVCAEKGGRVELNQVGGVGSGAPDVEADEQSVIKRDGKVVAGKGAGSKAAKGAARDGTTAPGKTGTPSQVQGPVSGAWLTKDFYKYAAGAALVAVLLPLAMVVLR